ncbi:MAG: hypothetical protein RSA91_00335 [Bacilli bacterium]
MGSHIDKIVITFLVILVLIVSPMMQVFSNIDKTAQNQVNVITNQFQKEVRNRGFLDKELYETFNKNLISTGRIYNVKLQHKKLTYYPLKESNPQYKISKPFMEDYYIFNEKQIFNKIYNQNNLYKMKKGDEFSVLVEEMEGSTKGTKVFWGYVIQDPKNLPKIFSKFGGVVENELR